MNNCFIILAAGNSKRFRSKIPKQFINYKGLMLFEHSIKKVKKTKLFNKIILVINHRHKKYIDRFKDNNVKIIFGGNERSISSFKALKFIKKYNPKNVFIHDAARPNFSLKLLYKLYKGLKKNKCVVPYLTSNNSLKLKNNKKIINLDRTKVYETQTPQCFDYNLLLNISKLNKKVVTDESALFINSGIKVNFIKGESFNKKITKLNDLENNFKNFYGIGFDVHRLVPNRNLYLGGIKIKSDVGTLGHSDGDPILHAVTDGILGACNLGDIGKKFPDTSKKYKNIRSTILLKKVMSDIKKKNYTINNIDINVITQRPKISLYRKKIIQSISMICDIPTYKINIKGKTTEKLGVIGKEKAIACEVITSVSKYDE
tara:strand:+ start:938 stop:2056 length:1119 start_codon:yes stop_codon:yes gene_type:complete